MDDQFPDTWRWDDEIDFSLANCSSHPKSSDITPQPSVQPLGTAALSVSEYAPLFDDGAICKPYSSSTIGEVPDLIHDWSRSSSAWTSPTKRGRTASSSPQYLLDDSNIYTPRDKQQCENLNQNVRKKVARECNFCGKPISLSNFKRHVRTQHPKPEDPLSSSSKSHSRIVKGSDPLGKVIREESEHRFGVRANSVGKFPSGFQNTPSSKKNENINLEMTKTFQTKDAIQPMEDDPWSSDTNESQGSSPDAESRMLLLYSKHKLMVKLMQDVYVIFDRGWSSFVSSCAGSEASSSSSPVGQENPMSRPQGPEKKSRKRGREEQDSGDDEAGKRRRNDRSDTVENGKENFACPFFQQDPIKYSCNNVTGSKYRACTGPGFENISRLKQHLKRVHRSPIQCTRCWVSMKTVGEMSEHANSENRCKPREPDPQGISQDKMDLISGKWGASWENIFEILFPGAPILTPYYGSETAPATTPTSSPNSQDLSDFETYSRTELPRLIEANLQVMVDTDFAPIEENVKKLLVDVVRRCQSTVAQNYGRIKSSTSPTMTQASTDVAPPPAPATDTEHLNNITSIDSTFFRSAFEEPPFKDQSVFSQWTPSNTGDSATAGPIQSNQSLLGLHSDSGYGTIFDDDECHCSESQESIGLVDGLCVMCGLKKPFIWSFENPLRTEDQL